MDLAQSVRYLKGVGPKKCAALERLGICTIADLLTYYPRTYEDRSALKRIADLMVGEKETTSGVIMNVQEKQSGRGLHILTALISDGSGYLQVTWFNQKFLKNTLRTGKRIFITGKVNYAYGGRGQYAISQVNSFQVLDDGAGAEEDGYCGIHPVYAATEKLNQKFFRKLMHALFMEKLEIHEVLPAAIGKRYGLMERQQAFAQIHFPADFSCLKQARKRLVFEELYLIQCGLLWLKKQNQEEQRGIRHLLNSTLVRQVETHLPFVLTRDQQKVWREICGDMEKSVPMRRLVQGDVGSGKTVLAMLALVKTVENGYQGALMAPTEILARQHYENFCALLSETGIRIGFLSGHLTSKQHREMKARIASHEVDLLVGTHALIQDDVCFAHLGLAITDEQHRFGIGQRAALEKKGEVVPDVLVMTATPIPRTMTLTVYGDLDVSLIRELPPGRQPIRTFVRTPERRALIYQFVLQELQKGRQAYVVCPIIEMNEEGKLSSVENVYEELQQGIFRDMKCGMVHGKMPSQEKEAIMQDFYENRVQLLVATTVIEVGVNVPNASIMVVENADRFGLAQLHQLRGRIGRGEYKSYCILVSAGHTGSAKERLKIMETTADGFNLAEEDLKLRGPGQFFGSMQHGLPDLKIADVLGDMDILLQARQAALETMEDQDMLQYVMQSLRLQYKKDFFRIMET